MGFLGCIVVVVLLLLVACLFDGDGQRAYEEYRRAEFRNEYLWERKHYSDQRFEDVMIGIKHL